MKLARLLFKPKWQDKDPATRRSAVSTDADATLLAALPEIARNDADATVRIAALQRLHEYEAWRERSTGDADPAVRRAARDAYLALLCSGAADAPAVARRIAELETLSEAEIERVAVFAQDTMLRREALARISKPSLLAQRAIADPDPQLRLTLIERIGDAPTLQRIAERARKTDKALSRRARELLERAGIASGDAAAIATKARALCEQAEALMRTPHERVASELDAIEVEWTALGKTVPTELVARFRGAQALALRALEPRQSPASDTVTPAESAQIADVETEVTPPAVPPAASPTAVDSPDREQRERRRAQQRELEQHIGNLASALDAGDSATAHRLHAIIEQTLGESGRLFPDLTVRFEPLRERHAEMKRWQHWSNNQRRRKLCDEIETLLASAPHPDALATRIREAREEWQRLNTAEGVSVGAEASDGLSRRFHGLCQRALRPTKAYFAKRKEIRQTHTHEIEALLAQAAEIPDDSDQWAAIAALRTQAGSALRQLDGVEPARRSELAGQLKQTIARMTTLSNAHEREIESARAALIKQAQALADRNDAAAARETRELQKRWTALGQGHRSTDQRQWREFRAACDAVFGKLDEERKQREAATVASKVQARQLVDEFGALANESESNAEQMRKRLRELESGWASIACGDKNLVRQQRELHDRIVHKIKDGERRQRLARFSMALSNYALVRAMEMGSTDPLRWEEFPSAGDFDVALKARSERAGSGASFESDEDAARDVLVRLEFLAGTDSPAEDRQRRMNHQVERLSSRLREGTATSPERDLSELLNAWFAQPPQTPALEDRFAAAARAAIESLP